MTRFTANGLADSLTESGFSCQVTIGKDQACTVRVLALRVVHQELLNLVAIGDRHGCELHLIEGDALTYFTKRETRA